MPGEYYPTPTSLREPLQFVVKQRVEISASAHDANDQHIVAFDSIQHQVIADRKGAQALGELVASTTGADRLPVPARMGGLWSWPSGLKPNRQKILTRQTKDSRMATREWKTARPGPHMAASGRETVRRGRRMVTCDWKIVRSGCRMVACNWKTARRGRRM
jgi:hypothetical protein